MIHVDDVDRLSDNITRLLTAINAANAAQAKQLRESMRTHRYQRRASKSLIRWIFVVFIMAVAVGIGGYWWLQRTLPAVPLDAPAKTAIPSLTPNPAIAAPCQVGQIKANPRTMIYHMPDGAYYATTKNSDVQCFDSVDAVESAGFRRAKR